MASKIDPIQRIESAPWTSQGELNRITDLQRELEYRGSFVASATRCRGLGWRLAAVDALELIDLEVNFSDAPEVWLQNLGQLGPLQGRVGLWVHTGAASGLLVLEVQSGTGVTALDHFGEWNSPCQARVNGREQHYYTLPPECPEISTSFLTTFQVMVYGEKGLAPVPPSVDLQTRETWRWLGSPWEYPPPEAPQPIWSFLRQHLPLDSTPYLEAEVSSWEEIYRLISSHEQVLKAILAPTPSPEEYYRNLLRAALDKGFDDRTFLLGLLWHAPRGDARPKPEHWAHLESLVNEVRPGPPGNGRFLEARDREESTAGFDAWERGSRYEAIQGELKRLTQKAGELEGILSQWDQDLPPAPDSTIQAPKALAQGLVGQYLTPPGEEREVENLLTIFEGCLHQGYKAKAPVTTRRATPPINQDQDNNGVRLAYAELPPKDSLDQQPELIEATMRACLQRHPDLAGDPLKIQMIHYCFKNYVNIDPAMSDLTLQQRVERASQMAREFLGMRGPS